MEGYREGSYGLRYCRAFPCEDRNSRNGEIGRLTGWSLELYIVEILIPTGIIGNEGFTSRNIRNISCC